MGGPLRYAAGKVERQALEVPCED